MIEYIPVELSKYSSGFLSSRSQSLQFSNSFFLLQTTLNSNFRLFSELKSWSSFLVSKSLGSALIGSSPRRWTSSSSGMTEVFWYRETLWKAIVGISAMMILRSPLARAASMPLSSISNSYGVFWVTLMSMLSLSLAKLKTSCFDLSYTTYSFSNFNTFFPLINNADLQYQRSTNAKEIHSIERSKELGIFYNRLISSRHMMEALIMISYSMIQIKEHVSDRQPPFGKYQRIIAIILFMGFQFMLYFFGTLTIYAILTLNFQLMVFIGFLSFIQSFARRSNAFIYMVNEVLQIKRYPKTYELILQEPISDTKKCLFGLHPHGVFSTALLANMNLKSAPFDSVAGLSSRMLLACPFIGFCLRLWGVEAVDSNNMKKMMKQGKNIMLLPGGFEEATLTNQNQLRIYIKNRKGFIKYAMEHNYSIYPMISINENRAFQTFDYFKGLRLLLNKVKLPGVFFWSPKTLLFVPPDMQYYSVVGKKINYSPIEPGETASQSEIDRVHQEYIDQLVRIYNKYKHLNGDVPLKIY